jgi:hypothetical protein
MNYRLLLPDEYDRLKPLFEPHAMPYPETSCIAVAEDEDGAIKGFWCLQLQWHMEPLKIMDARVNFLRLKELLDNQLRAFPGSCYYALVETDKTARIAERSGMRLYPGLIFKGELE